MPTFIFLGLLETKLFTKTYGYIQNLLIFWNNTTHIAQGKRNCIANLYGSQKFQILNQFHTNNSQKKTWGNTLKSKIKRIFWEIVKKIYIYIYRNFGKK